MGRAALAALGILLTCSEVAAEGSASRFHVGLDLQWRRENVRFVDAGSFIGCEECAIAPVRSDGLRGTASIGLSGVALEASLAMAYGQDNPLGSWTLGLRFDTGYASVVSVAFRLAYLRRWGGQEGVGGRLAMALQLRVVRAVVLYGEAGIDVVTVPGDLNALFSYATYFAGGVRFVFAR